VRAYEVQGRVRRFEKHEFVSAILDDAAPAAASSPWTWRR